MTISQIQQEIHNQAFLWSKRHEDGRAYINARTMEKKYGRDYYIAKAQLISDGILSEVVPPHYYKRDETGKKKKGTSTGYSVNVAPTYPIIHEATLTAVKPYTTFEKHYLDTHARSNLSNSCVIIGSGDDTRNYTDVSIMTKDKRKNIEIDDDETVEVDISNTFFLAVSDNLPKNTKHTKEFANFEALVFEGLLYNAYVKKCNVSRGNVKLALTIALNQKSRLTYNNYDLYLVWHAFRSDFPHVAKFIRMSARSKTSWKMCVGWEGRIRNIVLDKAYGVLGYTPLDVHDGFIIKKSDVDTFTSILLAIKTVPFKSGGLFISSAISPLVCNAPSKAGIIKRFFAKKRPPRNVIETG